MAAESDTDGGPLATYFQQTHIMISDRGEPPLANAADSLLDRDRIHLSDE
jgi:hypothetical protein